ncbi:hypothetical protein EVAR_96176_1 [Eumeta japonica]|uniref:Uncharacterized protein n=1 Tax=Eumeta variegata TaxID=151549 RepID=A0A4C1VL33_EUMVA|nr:hypothetical protein EVAR_96176_1 [Eumeta japonica]
MFHDSGCFIFSEGHAGNRTRAGRPRRRAVAALSHRRRPDRSGRRTGNTYSSSLVVTFSRPNFRISKRAACLNVQYQCAGRDARRHAIFISYHCVTIEYVCTKPEYIPIMRSSLERIKYSNAQTVLSARGVAKFMKRTASAAGSFESGAFELKLQLPLKAASSSHPESSLKTVSLVRFHHFNVPKRSQLVHVPTHNRVAVSRFKSTWQAIHAIYNSTRRYIGVLCFDDSERITSSFISVLPQAIGAQFPKWEYSMFLDSLTKKIEYLV